MHALQVLPLFVLLLEVLSQKLLALRDAGRRFRLVMAAVLTFAGAVAILIMAASRTPPTLTTQAQIITTMEAQHDGIQGSY